MKSHHVEEWSPFVDYDSQRTFALGVCVHCSQTVVMSCQHCTQPMYVRGMVLVCSTCDMIGDFYARSS